MHELHSKESWPDVLYALEALSRVFSLCRLTMISRRYAVQPYYVFIEGLDGRLRILDTREEIDALLAAHGRTDKGDHAGCRHNAASISGRND